MKHYKSNMKRELLAISEQLVADKQLVVGKSSSRIDADGTIVHIKNMVYNLPCAIDFETTSTTTADGAPFAFIYAWALAFGVGQEHIYYGRSLEELRDALFIVSTAFDLGQWYEVPYGKNGGYYTDSDGFKHRNVEQRQLVMYAHNLGFEFQFVHQCLNWNEVRAMKTRSPYLAESDIGIVFKDSLILAGGMSLDTVAKNLTSHTIPKLMGNLDYDLVRHAKTLLTQEELDYLENDVRIVCAYISEQIAQYDNNITYIPATNTGRVRREGKSRTIHRKFKKSDGKKVRDVRSNKYRKLMASLIIQPDEYELLRKTFAGGFTHANPNYVERILEYVASYDFTSSYPAVMCSEKFPMSSGQEVVIESWDEIEVLRKEHCLKLHFTFNNVRSRIKHETYMSESRCVSLTNPVVNNGRVVSADTMEVHITDVDLDIMKDAYHWDSIIAHKVTKYYKTYLPFEIIEMLLDLYQKKTLLKGVKDMLPEYNNSKSMLNSVYGMCVTDIAKPDIIYKQGEWSVDIVDLYAKMESYNNSAGKFLFYPWGVWITAYARRNLWSGIVAVGSDYVYSDTDSLKILNHEKHAKYFEDYNAAIKAKMIAACEARNLPIEMLCPQGKWMGVWDFEGVYKKFKTLGAKRYLVQKHDGSLEITVAGLPKDAGVRFLEKRAKIGDTFDSNDEEQVLNAFDLFRDDMKVPSDESRKLTHHYCDIPTTTVVKDYRGEYLEVSAPSFVHLSKTEYNLSMSDKFSDFLQAYHEGKLEALYA